MNREDDHDGEDRPNNQQWNRSISIEHGSDDCGGRCTDKQRSQPKLPASVEDLVGGWPEDELNDGFEEMLARWRKRELEPRE